MRMCICETWEAPESLEEQLQFSGQTTEEESDGEKTPEICKTDPLRIQLIVDPFIRVRKL